MITAGNTSMKSTLFALLLSLAFQGSASAQLQITYLDEIPLGGFWQHYISSDLDGNQRIIFDYNGLCASSGGHPSPAEAVALEISNPGPNSLLVPYYMSLVCGGSSPFTPEPFIDDPTLRDQIIGDWNALGRPGLWIGTLVIPAGFNSGLSGFYQMQGAINFNYENEAQGSCCVNSGCSSTGETTCTELGGTWTEGGSCNDCEPVADDCPADVDGDGSIGFSDVLIILNDWGACP